MQYNKKILSPAQLCNSAAIHAFKPIAHRNTAPPPVLGIKCALISRTSINGWKIKCHRAWEKPPPLQLSFRELLKFFLMVIF